MIGQNNPGLDGNLLPYSVIHTRIKLLCHSNNQKRINTLLKMKVNDYIAFVLANFILKKLEQINVACKLIDLDLDKRDKVHTAFIGQLEKIRYSAAYYMGRGFKRVSKDSFELDYGSFNNSMLKEIPFLEKPDEFISKALGIKEKTEHIMIEVGKIKRVINEYVRINKKDIVTVFNKEIDALVISLTKKSFFEVFVEVKEKIAAFLNKMQLSENRYYEKLTFFASYRQSNSSLQLKINEAKIILNNLTLTEETSKNVKKTDALKTIGSSIQ